MTKGKKKETSREKKILSKQFYEKDVCLTSQVTVELGFGTVRCSTELFRQLNTKTWTLRAVKCRMLKKLASGAAENKVKSGTGQSPDRLLQS